MVLGIDPERGRSLEAAAQRYQQILRDVVGGKTKFFSFRTFDSQPEIRLIKGLLNPQIGRSGNTSHFGEQYICIAPVCLQVISDDLYIDGSW